MISPHRPIEALIEIFEDLAPFSQPADLVLRRYFRAHPQLGQKDRALLAETAFFWLRHRRSLTALAGEQARANVLLSLNRGAGFSLRELAPALKEAERQWLAAALAHEPSTDPAVRSELPDWLYARLCAQWGEEECLAFGFGAQTAAPLDLRVNTRITSRPALQAELAASGVEAEPTPYSPLGLRVRGKPALQNHALFRQGQFEVQDEGSQLIGLLLEPGRHQTVVDFCAGAGGKTLALAAAMSGQGQIYALDPQERRLRNLRERLARAGFTNVQPWLIANEADPKLERLANKADRVLVDAPCSGFGTLRRNPDLKWRHGALAVAELATKQASILQAAASLVKPGGRLVYATCSVLADENEAIVERFLSANPQFQVRPANQILAAAKVPLSSGRYLQLLPHRHGCDGFFAAALERLK